MNKILLFCILSSFFFSCKKLVEIPLPVDQLSSDFVFNDNNTAIQAVTGIYSEMMNNSQQFSAGQVTLLAGMAADELYRYTPGLDDEFVNNEISLVNHPKLDIYIWSPCYRYIYAANRCIEGATNAKNLSSEVKQMIIGESSFIRAFCYYYLVNLFGDVPLITSSDYRLNQSLPRTSADLVYAQIVDDLKMAWNSLLINYPTAERVRPNKMAAAALLARVYLEHNDWEKAETEASFVINSQQFSLGNLTDIFRKSSSETIWQLKPVNPSRNTWEAFNIIPSSTASAPTYLLTPTLINSFETNDQRKSKWINQVVFASATLNYPYKYKILTGPLDEYYIVLRLAELYLIRAEAYAQQNKISQSQSDLNRIRLRAGLGNTSANDKPSLLSAIEHEWQVEFFSEWGHRWLNLKRTGRASSILGMLKPNTWQSTDELWPIPESQIKLNPSLTQNKGY